MSTFALDHLSVNAVSYAVAGNAILGIRDSGKTYTATFIAERLFDAGIPFVAFDPIGVWRFLRVPGKGNGYPIVVAGGQDGDLALTPASAPAIVEAAMQNGISLVIDLFSIELSKADWRRIVRDSVKLLLHKNAAHGLRHIFIEEASEFVPQRVIDGEVYSAVEKLARMGGNAHLGYTLINQRAEEVNKAVLELCDNLFLHRQKGRNSLTALSKWLDIGAVKDHREIIDSLSTLPTGKCWAWLGGTERPVLVQVPAKQSLHPDRRITRENKAVIAAAVDVGQWVETLRAALPAIEADAADNDPKLLRRRIAELERARSAPANQLDDAEIARREQAAMIEGRTAGYTAALEDLCRALEKPMEAMRAASRAMFESWDASSQRFARGLANASAPVREEKATHGLPEIKRAAPPMPAVKPPKVEVPAYPGGDVFDLAVPEQRVLDAIAWCNAARIATPLRHQVAFAARYTVNGHFNNICGKLNAKGLLEYPSPGALALTSAGRKLAKAPHGNPSRSELIERVGATLRTEPSRRVFEALAKAERELAREELARRCNYTVNGHFNNVVGALHGIGVVEYPRQGHVGLAGWLQ